MMMHASFAIGSDKYFLYQWNEESLYDSEEDFFDFVQILNDSNDNSVRIPLASRDDMSM